ncbi:hypothetical protein [Achromobacter sp. ACRQX]|uniref:hypothetical protein n=1 Tax=Achromobacter sp. ACRQX TaxID=2918181 RepID=UPI001EF3BA08|nr:hypothetical protein [Achromobacter sp. ACRQX]MCG7328231.1 hypothetical protein [Achromobacter sp. ACRQX]
MARKSLIELADTAERLARSVGAAAHVERPALTKNDFSDFALLLEHLAEDLNARLKAAGIDRSL